MPTTPNYSQPAILSEVATPSAPDAGYIKVYGKAGLISSIANGGSEIVYASQAYVTAAVSGGGITTAQARMAAILFGGGR